MTQQVSSVDALREQWQQLSEFTKDAGNRMVAKINEWKAARESEDRALMDALWSEKESLYREFEIARARDEVAYAWYLVAKYNLNEADIFG